MYEACETLEMKTLHERREDLCYKFVAKAMKQHPHLYPKRKARCKKCPGCIKDDCGTCEYCKDMKKFGGPGRKKQACAERNCSAGY